MGRLVEFVEVFGKFAFADGLLELYSIADAEVFLVCCQCLVVFFFCLQQLVERLVCVEFELRVVDRFGGSYSLVAVMAGVVEVAVFEVQESHNVANLRIFSQLVVFEAEVGGFFEVVKTLLGVAQILITKSNVAVRAGKKVVGYFAINIQIAYLLENLHSVHRLAAHSLAVGDVVEGVDGRRSVAVLRANIIQRVIEVKCPVILFYFLVNVGETLHILFFRLAVAVALAKREQIAVIPRRPFIITCQISTYGKMIDILLDFLGFAFLRVSIERLRKEVGGTAVMSASKIQKSNFGVDVGIGNRALLGFLVGNTLGCNIIIQRYFRFVDFVVGTRQNEVGFIHKIFEFFKPGVC